MIEPRAVSFTDTELYNGSLSNIPDGLCSFRNSTNSTIVYYKYDGRIRFIMWFETVPYSSVKRNIYCCVAVGEESVYSPYLGDRLKRSSFEVLTEQMIKYPELAEWVLFNLDRFEDKDGLGD